MKQPTSDTAPAGRPPVVQLYVFRGDECLGWDCFCKEEIFIGSGEHADLQLSDGDVADIHAVLTVKDGRLLVSYSPSDCGKPGIDDSTRFLTIGPLDSLVIGTYTLKAKLAVNGKRMLDAGPSPQKEASCHETHDALPSRDRDDCNPEPQARVRVGETPGDADNAHAGSTHSIAVGPDDTSRYNLIFEGRIRDDFTLDEVKKNLGALLKKDGHSIDRLFSGKKAILKRDADHQSVRELRDMFESTGALCIIEPCVCQDQSVPMHPEEHRTEHERQSAEPQIPSSGKHVHAEAGETPGKPLAKKPVIMDDDDDEDEDEAPATFSLKEKIRDYQAPVMPGTKRSSSRETLLEVVKSRDDTVYDVRYLGAREQYLVRTENGTFCLAENRGNGEIILNLDDQSAREVTAASSSETRHDSGHHQAVISSRSGNAGTRRLSDREVAVIHMGSYEYLLRQTTPSESPQVKESAKKDRVYARHFGRSVVFHVVLLVILGMMPTYKPDPVSDETGRFVRLDSRQLEEISETAKAPELPKKAPEIVKLKEDQIPQSVVQKHLATTPVDRRIAGARSATAGSVSSKSPAGGGGSGSGGGGGGSGSGGGGGGGGTGPGNVVTSNVHQAGILSMIGDNIGIKPQEAMAAVTNLDAVNSPVASKSQFKVGGIVGKLDGGRIEIPKAGIVNTKGSSQVLRSSAGSGGGTGTGGPGSGGSGGPGGGGGTWVAALDKGTTGKQQVKAKVTAQLNKTVKVQGGGMSREEVKRIIDQHLDEISRCYETALVSDPSLMGRVVFEWKILMSGKVGEVRIKSSTLKSTDIHSCMQASIKSWEFPQPDGDEVVVSYPFIFDIVGF